MNPQDIFGMMGGGMNMADLFGGGMGMGGGGMRKRRGRDIGVRVPVELATLYTGGKKEVSELPRTVLCTGCKGTGSKHGKKNECTDCQGRGMKLIRRMLGPGMVQQMQVPCDKCEGQGNVIKEKDRCKECNGQKCKEVERTLKVEIVPGMKDGTQIPFEGEGDHTPEIDIPGAVVVVLQQEPHKEFQRDDDDLVYHKTISLQEALMGFAFELVHLDGRKLYIRSPKDKVVTPEMKLIVKGEGMPVEHEPGKRGDLVVVFALEFPRMLDDDQVKQLKAILPAGPKQDKDHPAGEEPEECFMDDYTPEQWKEVAKIGEEEEEDEEEEGGAHGRCAAQ
eukprot:TRINITY_DN21158_c0_g1_i1.p1 TRINITY_DN21158_c0_g1~~TRINITY_DN21158_c0_g1_i1.p1  ORF type:complete len:335 (+),score=112.27 TRINITY_DN21158_c0_g1_i1:772-1776(+)